MRHHTRYDVSYKLWPLAVMGSDVVVSGRWESRGGSNVGVVLLGTQGGFAAGFSKACPQQHGGNIPIVTAFRFHGCVIWLPVCVDLCL